MNIKNQAAILGANRSSSLAPIQHNESNKGEQLFPRQSSVSTKPATNQVSPRMAPIDTILAN